MSKLQRLTARLPRVYCANIDDRLLEAGALAVDLAPPNDEQQQWVSLTVYLDATVLAAVRGCLRKSLGALPKDEQRRITREFVVSDVDDAWQTQWSEGLEPVVLVPGLVLVPEGTTYEPQANERTMMLEKGLVFGFGEHATTRMIAAWLATKVRSETVLDVGCGTGVLAFVAAHHGAALATGIDIDAASVASARRNALRNGWQSVCTFEELPLEELDGQFGVVVANVDALTIERLCGAIAAKLAPTGALALTGILEEQSEAVRAAFVAYGVHLRVCERSEGWVLLTTDG